MDLLRDFLDLFLHLDRHLGELIARYGTGTYGILFLVVFCETGLVLTPFLPGDSLLFAAGMFAGMGALDPLLVFLLLFTASATGDSCNYWIGRAVGPRAFSGSIRFLRQDYLDRTREFYHRHGRTTIILARFLPILRTFAPFVAGVGAMPYPTFVAFSVTGSALWVGLFVGAGRFFGTIPAVREHFTLVVMGIIVISVLPLAWRAARHLMNREGPMP